MASIAFLAILVFFLMMQIYEISRHRIILFKGDIYQYLKYFKD